MYLSTKQGLMMSSSYSSNFQEHKVQEGEVPKENAMTDTEPPLTQDIDLHDHDGRSTEPKSKSTGLPDEKSSFIDEKSGEDNINVSGHPVPGTSRTPFRRCIGKLQYFNM